MSDAACGFEPRTWFERNASWLIGLVGLAAAALLSYGVATGTAGERLAAQDRRIEQVEARQAQTDSVVEKVRDALIKIGEDTAVTRTRVESVGDQVGRMERRLDSLNEAGAGARRNQ